MASATAASTATTSFRSRTPPASKNRRFWDVLSREGKDSIIIGVPPTYPVKPLRGSLISCFLTPGSQSQFTYPHDLRPEVQRLVGDYMVECEGFRTDKKQWLLSQIYEMTTKRFTWPSTCSGPVPGIFS